MKQREAAMNKATEKKKPKSKWVDSSDENEDSDESDDAPTPAPVAKKPSAPV